ncbi:hypothetical protein LTR15_000360 [Elasticomyces elasticus]|nr:hypothetical protein LTR15_000360 [Elasticomyces elasticus]
MLNHASPHEIPPPPAQACTRRSPYASTTQASASTPLSLAQTARLARSLAEMVGEPELYTPLASETSILSFLISSVFRFKAIASLSRHPILPGIVILAGLGSGLRLEWWTDLALADCQ